MHIVCDNCGTEYDYDLPVGHSGRNVRFRCSACGHRFVAVRQEDNPAPAEPVAPPPPVVEVVPAAPPAPAPAPPSGGTLLKQGGVTYEIGDQATLQRWIVERRIFREDLVSTGDGQWEIVGLRPDLEPFFQVVEAAGLGGSASVGMGASREPWPFRPPSEPAEDAADETQEASLDAPTEEAPTTAAGPPASAFGAGASFGSGASFGGGASFSSGSGVFFDNPTEEEPRRSPVIFGAPEDAEAVSREPVLVGGIDANDVMPPPKEISMGKVLVAMVAAGVGIGVVWAWLNAPVEPTVAVEAARVEAPPPVEPVAPPPVEAPKPEAPKVEAPKAEPAKAAPPKAETPKAAEPAKTEARPARTEGASTTRTESKPAESKPRGSAASLIKRGWSEIDAGNFSEAESLFSAAVSAAPSSAAAHYGLGYVYEKRRDINNAGNEYCTAQRNNTKDEDLARELAGRLSVIGRTCP